MKLLEYLNKYGKTPKEVCEETGISISVIYRILRGENVHMKTAKKLSEKLNQEVKIDELRISKDKNSRKFSR